MSDIALDGSSAVLLHDEGIGRIRRISRASGVIAAFASSVSDGVGRCADGVRWNGGAGRIAINRAGTVFVAATLCRGGTSFNGVYRLDDPATGAGELILGSGTNETGEGLHASQFSLTNAASALAFDGVDNLYLASPHRIRRIESIGRVSTVAGAATSGSASAPRSAIGSVLNQPAGIAFDPDRNLVIAEAGNHGLRVVGGVAASTPSTAALAIAAGDAQTPFVAQSLASPLVVSLTDGMSPLAGYPIQWTTVTPGAALGTTSTSTLVSGQSSNTARAALSPGMVSWSARVRTIHGSDVVGSPAAFRATASSPARGTIFTVANADGTLGTAALPAPATTSRFNRVDGAAVDNDGSVFFTDDSHRVFVMSPSGQTTVVAGTGTNGYAGDGGSALSAQLSFPEAIALDRVRRHLYFAEGGRVRIRRIDLSSGVISTFAGSGAVGAPTYGDGGPATNARFNAIADLILHTDGLLYVNDLLGRIRRIDPTTGIIQTWVRAQNESGG